MISKSDLACKNKKLPSWYGTGPWRPREHPMFWNDDDGDSVKREGDDEVTRCPLAPWCAWERKQMIESKRFTREQILAFTYANKADIMYDKEDPMKAQEYAYKALRLDPLCTDAYRILLRVLLVHPQTEGDSIQCMYRELLYVLRELIYNDMLYEHPGEGTDHWELRPYIRLLQNMATGCVVCEKGDVAVHIYEEILRTDNEDHSGARQLMAVAYLRLLGLQRRKQPMIVTRTRDQLEALYKAHLPKAHGPLWGCSSCMKESRDALVRRWIDIIFMHDKGDERWLKRAREEDARCDLVSRLIFDETKRITTAREPIHRDVKLIDEAIANATLEWPMFVNHLHGVLRMDRYDDCDALSKATKVGEFMSRDYKASQAALGDIMLEKGRQDHKARSFREAIAMYTHAKRHYVETTKPSQRWYVNAPWQIVSNRAACAESLKSWWSARHDTRWTLFLKPDHTASYERLPRIAHALSAFDLEKELTKFVADVKSKKERPQGEWRELAAFGIAMMSASAIIHSRIGKLTEAKKKQLIEVGIEDMYTSINVPLDILPQLPWLSDQDIEVV